MNYEQFIREVMERTGMQDDEAVCAIEACVRVLGEGLSDLPAQKVCAKLPRALRPLLQRSGPLQTLSAETFFARVSELEGVRVGVALERAEVILQTIYAVLDSEARRLLREDLPEDLLDMAGARPSYHPPPARPIPPARVTRRMSSGTSLAQGRPTSESPLSEAGAPRWRTGSWLVSDEGER